MSMNFTEPEIQQTVSISDVLEKLAVSSENKEWLSNLFLKNIKLHSDFVDNFSNFLNKINKEDTIAFILFFLFGFCVSNHEYFDENKLKHERIKIIPSLFTQATEGKPSVFKHYIANILDNIQDCAEKDKIFSEAYQEYLQKIRAGSSFEERAVYYVKLVLKYLPKRTYKKDEKPLTPEIINSFLDFSHDDFYFNNKSYSVRLVVELEDMPEDELYEIYFFPGNLIPRYNISAFPFIVCGKELFTCVHKTVSLLLRVILNQKLSVDDIEQIRIPSWDENNYIHELFFNLASASKDKDILRLILDKIFKGVSVADIPYIFFEYIEKQTSSIYGLFFNTDSNYRPFLKGEYYDVIEPIRAELEYLDWALTSGADDPHKIYFEKSQLFLDYIDKLSEIAPKDKLELFQEMFFQGIGNNHTFYKSWIIKDRTIKEILNNIAREKIKGEWKFSEQQKKADGLYEKFVDVIAKGAAKYPLQLFFPEEYWRNILSNITNKHELAVFKRYCEILELRNSENALYISKVWFNRFHDEKSVQRLNSQLEYFSELKEREAFFYNNVFSKYINDEEFVCRFLSIPQSFYSGHFLTTYYIACWILYQNKNGNVSDMFNEASKVLLHGKKIVFPEKLVEFIKSFKILDELSIYGNDNEGRQFLFKLFAALGGEQYHSILENIYGVERQFPLYFIRYNYSHDKFIQEEFLDFLLNLENPNQTPSWIEKENKIYNLELIQKACIEKVLEKQIVLEKVCDYINKNRKELFKSLKIKSLISYFFIETEKGKNLDVQTVFFMRFCELAVQENDDLYEELYWFLKIRSYFNKKTDEILEKNKEINDALTTRCCKMLNNLKKNIEQKKFPNDEYTFLNDYILPASDFVWEKTGNIWKALKPLILSFRASKDILLNESLDTNNSFLVMITSFFRIEWQEKLKELRYDMAEDFAKYIKSAKNERQAEKYTQTERETEGFDLSYTEPSPYWRYAYVRALGDLGIKTDRRGHYFQKILENVSEKDSSEDVRTAAKKVMDVLDSIRKGYSGANHKKCLFEAFWWLKYAHILSLGGTVDSKKALEQRIKEWR